LFVAADSAELLFGFGEAGGGPSASHVAVVAPPFHVTGFGAHDVEGGLDDVGAYQGFGEGAVDAETSDGEHLIEAFAKTPSGVRVGSVKFSSEPFRFHDPAFGVWVGERSGEAAVDGFAVGFGEMTTDVAAFVQL